LCAGKLDFDASNELIATLPVARPIRIAINLGIANINIK
jgi:hypothetical protein